MRLLLAAMVASIAAPAAADAAAGPDADGRTAICPGLCTSATDGRVPTGGLCLDRSVRDQLARATAQLPCATAATPVAGRRVDVSVTHIVPAGPRPRPAAAPVLAAAPKTSPPTTTTC